MNIFTPQKKASARRKPRPAHMIVALTKPAFINIMLMTMVLYDILGKAMGFP